MRETRRQRRHATPESRGVVDPRVREADARRKALEEELSAKLAAAEAQIAATRDRAMANVADIAKDATAAIVERLIGRTVDPGVVASAVEAAKPKARGA